MTSPVPAPSLRPPLVRPQQGRVVAGVCAGVAGHLAVSVLVVRLLVVATTVSGGIGLLTYVLLWAMVPPATTDREDEPRRRRGLPLWGWLAAGGLVVLSGGTALQLDRLGLDSRPGVVIPLVLLGAGVAVVWSLLDEQTRTRFSPIDPRHRGRAVAGIVIGILLCVSGLVLLLARGRSLGELADVGLAAVIVLGGIGLLVAPWLVRVWGQLRAEQAERARATERADIAAHLHDSVLQTLALIQRRAGDQATVARLARAQERELRAYLYGAAADAAETLAAACAAAVEEVEDLHGIPVELVITGDHDLDPDAAALVKALREAVLNAVRHGAPPVTAFVEVGPVRIEAFVRDHGPGFDLAEVPGDRLGVRGSVIGRMERHGGTATVRRLASGTEICLALPVRPPVPVSGEPT